MSLKPKIYCASRASIPERPAMWQTLRMEGANIISTWIDEAGDGDTGSFEELWTRIEGEILSCDQLVLYIELQDLPLKGALVEVGIAIGLGKKVIIVHDFEVNPRDLKPIGSWAKHSLVIFESDIKKACEHFY